MTAQTDLTNAYNEFIADFCEIHGECRATRDEAHEEADKLVEFGKAIGAAVLAFGGPETMVEDVVEGAGVRGDAGYIIARAAEVAYNA